MPTTVKLRRYPRKTGIRGFKAEMSEPRGVTNWRTIMVMITAITPSLNPISRSAVTGFGFGSTSELRDSEFITVAIIGTGEQSAIQRRTSSHTARELKGARTSLNLPLPHQIPKSPRSTLSTCLLSSRLGRPTEGLVEELYEAFELPRTALRSAGKSIIRSQWIEE